jgi:Apea-like HEPN
MTDALTLFSRKQARIIQRALAQLAGAKSYKSMRSIEDFGDKPFGRVLRLTNHRMVLLTDHGMEQVDRIVDTTVEVDPFASLADYADIWSASWKTLEELVSNGQMAESTKEWLSLISARIEPQIRSRVIIVPFVGVELKGIEELMLGSFQLLRPSVSHLEAMGVDLKWAHLPKIIAGYRDWELWLHGCARGTPRVAERRFRTLADLMAGLLAVAVAVLSKSGATRVFISPNMTGHDSHGDATWFSWEQGTTKFTIHRSGIRGVPFEVDSGMRDQLDQASEFATALRIFEADRRTPLEEAVARGFHWFADAHRDPTSVMQFVKYWSCIETFFSIDEEEITKSVSVGVAAVLVFGGYEFVPRDNYSTVKKRVASLYRLRSQAVHRASRTHVTESDVAELSRYTAQLLINMVSFVEQGYHRPDDIKQHSMRLDEQIERGRGVESAD